MQRLVWCCKNENVYCTVKLINNLITGTGQLHDLFGGVGGICRVIMDDKDKDDKGYFIQAYRSGLWKRRKG
jgi:hypothetical protein